MPRLAGTDIPEHKKVDIALTYVYGIGRSNVYSIISQSKVDAHKRAKELTNEEPHGLYVFRRYDTSIPEFGCEQVFEIKRAGVILGEAAICDGNVKPIP